MFGFRKRREAQRNLSELVEPARHVLAAFGELMEHAQDPFAIWDESLLPYPKKVILNAILLLVKMDNNPNSVKAYTACAFCLSFYQPGVGKYPLHQIGIDLSHVNPNELSDDGLLNLITANPEGKERYDLFAVKRAADWERISNLILAAQGHSN